MNNILTRHGFRAFNPIIARTLGPLPAVLLAELVNSELYWATNAEKFKRLTKHEYTGWFFHTREKIQESTGMSGQVQRTAQEALLEAEILEIKSMGLPRKNYFRINYQKLRALLDSNSSRDDDDSRDPDADGPDSPSEGGEDLEVRSTADGENDSRAADNERAVRRDTRQHGGANVRSNKTKQPRIKNKSKVNGTYPRSLHERGPNHQSTSTPPSTSVHKIQPDLSSPARAGAPADALAILDAYNAALGIPFADGDVSRVLAVKDELLEVRDLLNPEALEFIWDQYSDQKTRAEVQTKRISAFVGYGLLEAALEHQGAIRAHLIDEVDNRLDRLFRAYGNYVESVVSDLGYTITGAGGLEPNDSAAFFPPKQQRELRCRIYREHLHGRLPEEARDATIAAMEVA